MFSKYLFLVHFYFSISTSSELENAKKQFKANIQELVQQGMLFEAKQLLEEYEKLDRRDIDVYSIRGVIAIMEGDNLGAEKILEEGLALDTNNFDLLYNLAYLYELKGQNEKSASYYNRARQQTTDSKLKQEIDNILENLNDKIVAEKNNHENKIAETAEVNEFKEHKKSIKSQIKNLLEANRFKECELLINEYEKIVPDDIEILLFKSELALME